MHNRLVFRSKDGSSNYYWNKYTVGRGQHYVVNRYELNSRKKYKWNRYQVNTTTSGTHLWNKYSIATTTGYPGFSRSYKRNDNPEYTYTWSRQAIFPAGTTLYSAVRYKPKGIWDNYTTKQVPRYEGSGYGFDGNETPAAGYRYQGTNTMASDSDYALYAYGPYYPQAITDGYVRINGSAVSTNYNNIPETAFGLPVVSKTIDVQTVTAFGNNLWYYLRCGYGDTGYIDSETGGYAGASLYSGRLSTSTTSNPSSGSHHSHLFYGADKAVVKICDSSYTQGGLALPSGVSRSTIENLTYYEFIDALSHVFVSNPNKKDVYLWVYITQESLDSGFTRLTLKGYLSVNGFNTTTNEGAIFMEVSPDHQELVGYETQPDEYLGTITSQIQGYYPSGGVYTDETTQAERWAKWTYTMDYGDFIQTDYRTGTAYTNSKLTDRAYTNWPSYLYGDANYEILKQNRTDTTSQPDTVTSTDESAYPAAGAQGNYFYTFVSKVQNQATSSNGGLAYYPVTSTESKLVASGATAKFYKSYTTSSENITITSNTAQQAVQDGYYWFTYTVSLPSGSGTRWVYLSPFATYNWSGSSLTIEPRAGYPIYLFDSVLGYAWEGWQLYKEGSRSLETTLANSDLGLQAEYEDSHNIYLKASAPLTANGPGELISSVSSTDRNAYPDSGIQGDFFYVYSQYISQDTQTKGEMVDSVETYSVSSYPNDDIQGSYWYTFTGSEDELSKGEYLTQFTTTSDQYPDDGPYNGYWYVLESESSGLFPQNLVDEVYDSNSSKYPKNGEGVDGYYYIYQGLAPAVVYSITDTQIHGGVHYNQNINPEEDLEFGCAAAASIELDIFDDEVTAQKYLGLECDYYNKQGEYDEWVLEGRFIITDIKHKTKVTSTIVGYDLMSKFDITVEDWLNTLTYPIALSQLFTSLCAKCGVAYESSEFTNSNFMVYENVSASNITGRQVLAYIAQVAAGFAICTPGARIAIKNYTSRSSNLLQDKYVSNELAIYVTDPITKVIIKGTEDDLGTSYGSGDNVYTVTANPLLFVDDSSELDGVIQNIYSVVTSSNYTPGTVNLQQDWGIMCGDTITVDNKTFFVMEKDIKSDGVQLVCRGVKERTLINNQVNTELIALRGKTNELTRTLDSTISTLTNNTEQLNSKIEQTASSITTQINSQGNTISEIRQDLDGIQLTYNSSAGTASLRIGDVTVNQLVDGNYVQKTVAGIDMTGYVQFNDLSRSGSTTINGSNITTGTIGADRLNLTGAITWGDLSNDAKNQIVKYARDEASGVVSDIPEYIKGTYIDGTRIVSCNLQGCTLSAGTTSSGYIQMSSTGMNFHDANGKSIYGLGYYQGNYNYPYFTLGGGTDSYGTDQGMIKKYANGLWVGDSDGMSSSTVGRGTGIFIDFVNNKVYKYLNGVASQL